IVDRCKLSCLDKLLIIIIVGSLKHSSLSHLPLGAMIPHLIPLDSEELPLLTRLPSILRGRAHYLFDAPVDRLILMGTDLLIHHLVRRGDLPHRIMPEAGIYGVEALQTRNIRDVEERRVPGVL
ncbi:hypothetical protein PENTCL1PPCAC_4261, partial [Pristionchus entomophagus]